MVSRLIEASKFFGLCVVVVAIWLGLGVASFQWDRIKKNLGDPDPSKTGQFGDTFGAVNSLFSALGFAGIVYALIRQAGDRKQAAESEKEAARLALLAAHVHARAALTIAIQDEISTKRKILADSVQHDESPGSFESFVLQKLTENRDAQVKDLLGIAEHAGQESGWFAVREEVMRRLDEARARQKGKELAEKYGDYDGLF